MFFLNVLDGLGHFVVRHYILVMFDISIDNTDIGNKSGLILLFLEVYEVKGKTMTPVLIQEPH